MDSTASIPRADSLLPSCPRTHCLEEAVEAMRDRFISPEDVASLVVVLSRNVIAAAPPNQHGSFQDDTPGLEGFLWSLWYRLIVIADDDPSMHDRLGYILAAIMVKGKDGREGWRIWGNDFDWANLPIFWPALRECMNGLLIFLFKFIPDLLTVTLASAGPSVVDDNGKHLYQPYPSDVEVALSGDPPTDSARSRRAAQERTAWLNRNAFVARLWVLGVADMAFYGISTMRMELEPYSLSLDRRTLSESYGTKELDIENSATYIRIAGKQMYECRDILGPKGNPGWPSNAGAPGSSGGAWDGVDGYHPERWALWKAILKDISQREGRKNMIEAAKAAVVAMEKVEHEHGPIEHHAPSQ
ncbi:hypothetical protein BN946_scf185000.g3 [Trametes cinnabarina]|uniref:Uncharacterized protein n=1 Tax=Pycnoporus cinnabarinus TaxID=5643 RepID=A0A060S3J3_PYCCI|nr:hypothetical protein BN946_scf185000.g3 [Trametes cinnabarina]